MMNFRIKKYLNTDTRRNRIDLLFMVSITLLPFLFYLYILVPETEVWNVYLFEIHSGNFATARELVWYITIKLYTTFLLSLWFLSCTHKWRMIILFPIFAEFSKLLYLLNRINHEFFIDYFILETTLISIPYFVFLKWISAKFLYHREKGKLTKELNKEINIENISLSKYKSKNCKVYKEELIKILSQKNKISRRDYLLKLITLRDKISS